MSGKKYGRDRNWISNDILNLLEMIKSTLISKQLEIKCSSFLNYLYNFLGISEEQKNTIQEYVIKNPVG